MRAFTRLELSIVSRSLVLSFLMVSSLGCGDPVPENLNTCGQDLECGLGTCLLTEGTTSGICTRGPDEAFDVWIGVTPQTNPFGSTPVTEEFVVRVADGLNAQNMQLHGSVRVAGLLHQSDRLVDASLSFTQVTAELTTEPHMTSIRTTPTRATAEVTSNFEVDLLPDTRYSVRIEPTGDDREVFPVSYREIRTSAGDTLVVDFDYPTEMGDSREYPLWRLSGKIVSRACPDCAREPEDGVVVWAFDGDDAAAMPRVLSSVSTTGQSGESGRFEIVIPTSLSNNWRLYITASAQREEQGRPVPGFSVSLSELYPDDDGLVSVLVPNPSSAIPFQGFVEGYVEATPSDPMELVGATVLFVSREVNDASTGVRGRLETSAMTDDLGSFTAHLLPGDYDILIMPSTSEYRVGRFTRTVTEEATAVSGHIFTLASPFAYRATVSAGTLPLDRAEVSAVPIASLAMSHLDVLAQYARRVSSQTDRLGRTLLQLDTGFYDVVVAPNASSGFGWLVQPGVSVPEPTVDSEVDTRSTQIEMDWPSVVAGAVSYANQEVFTPAPNAEVRAYRLLSDDSGVTRRIEVARTQSDETGNYRLLISPRFRRPAE